MHPVAVSIHPEPPRRFGPAKADCTPEQARAKLDAAFKNLAARTYTRRELRRAIVGLLARSSRLRRPVQSAPRPRARAPRRPAVHRHGGGHAGGDGGGSSAGDDPAPPPETALFPANLIRFPLRGIGAVIIVRERGEWLTIVGDHGWSFSSLASAREEAAWLAANLDLPVRVLKVR